MSVLSEMASATKGIVASAGGELSAMGLDHLGQIVTAMRVCALAQSAALVERCGGEKDAYREIQRALDLPPSVLKRRYEEAAKVITLDGVPSIPQHAAIVARSMATIQTIEAEIARRGLN